MTEPRTRSWMPPIPGPLQRLFDVFPLATYPANDLPARSPSPSSLPTLHVFISEEDAALGRPSFNPSCLKWQTYLLLSNIPIRLTSSTNHASPTGSLPFLFPPAESASTAAKQPKPDLPPSPRPIPSTRFEAYIATHTTAASQPSPPPLPLQADPYQSLLDTRIRPAWLHALYLAPANARLLAALYIDPTTSSRPVRLAQTRALRAAAEAEVVRCCAPASAGTGGWRVAVGGTRLALSADSFRLPSAGLDPERVYADAAEAFGALAGLLAESGTGWFFGAEGPGLFDAAVFAYTSLAAIATTTAGEEEEGGLEGRAGGGLAWGDGGVLGQMVASAGSGELVRHRRRIWDMCFAEGGRTKGEE